jgi:hypothetical protein
MAVTDPNEILADEHTPADALTTPKSRRPRKTRPVDPELTALTAIVATLDALSPEARIRVAKYVMNRTFACETPAPVAPVAPVAPASEVRLPAEWLASKPDLRILDNDGWTTEEWGVPCTKAEFYRRLARCTVVVGSVAPQSEPVPDVSAGTPTAPARFTALDRYARVAPEPVNPAPPAGDDTPVEARAVADRVIKDAPTDAARAAGDGPSYIPRLDDPAEGVTLPPVNPFLRPGGIAGFPALPQPPARTGGGAA